MRVRSSGNPADVSDTRGGLSLSTGGRFVHQKAWSEKPTKANNASLSALVVNAYPQVESAMRRRATRVAAMARSSYRSMADTHAMAAGVQTVRGRSLQGDYKGVPHDFTVLSTDKGAAPLEFGHFTHTRKTDASKRRWVPGRHVMRNAARGATAAQPASIRRRASAIRARNRSRYRHGRLG